MIKLLAVDVDGTILNSQGEMTANTMKSLIEVQKAGVKLAICSGRPKYYLSDLAKRLEVERFEGYLVGANGNVVYSYQNKQLFHYNLMDEELVRAMFDQVKHRGIAVFVEGNNESYVYINPLAKLFLDLHQIIHKKQRNHGDIVYMYDQPFTRIYNKDQIRQRTNKLTVLHHRIFTRKLKEEINASYPELDAVLVTEISVEIFNKGVDKTNGIRKICEEMKITMEEVMSIGDGENDLRMVNEAGIGVAMGNAMECVKQAAIHVSDTNDREGVLKAVQKFLLSAD